MRKYAIVSLMCAALTMHAQSISPVGSPYIHPNKVEQQFRQAQLYYNENSFYLSQTMLREIISNPQSTDVQRREAAALLAVITYELDAATGGETIEAYLRDYPDAPDKNRMKALMLLSSYARHDFDAVTEGMNDVDPDQLNAKERDALILAYALSLIEEQRYEDAEAQLRILSLISDSYAAEITFYTAYTDYMNKRYEEAEKGFEQSRDVEDFYDQSCYYLAEISLATKEYTQAEKTAITYLQGNTKDDRLSLEMKRIQGEALYAQYRYLQAAIILEEYLAAAEKPKREALYQLGMAHFHSGEHLRAPEVLGMVCEGSDAMTQNAQLHSGLSFLKLGDKNKARLCFEQAAAMTADAQVRENAMYNYTVCVHETSYSGFGESVEILERFINEFPTSIHADQVNSYLVETYMNTKNYDAALLSIAKIQHPSTIILEAKQKLLYKAGAEAFANGDIAKAITKFNESLAVGDYDRQSRADALFWRGEANYRNGNFTQASKDYNQYLMLTKERQGRTYALALYGLGYAHFVQEKYQEAFRRFTQLQQAPSTIAGAIDKTTMADAQMRIGDCYFQARQYSAAEAAYDKSLQIDPSVADYAIYQKAFAQGLSGRYTDKIGTLTYLVENYPQSDYHDDALYEKGRAYVQLDKGNQAIQVFGQLLSRFPQSQYAPKAGNEIALIHYQNNEIRLAINAYKKVIIDYPGSEQANVAMRDLKNLYVEENMVDSYVEFASKASGISTIDVNEHDSLTYQAAKLAYTRGDEKVATEGFNKYLEQFAKGAYTIDAHYYLGCIYYKLDNYAQARNHLQFVSNHRNSKFCEEATRMMADLAYNHRDYEFAMISYGDLITITGTPSTKLHAQVHRLRSAQALGKLDVVTAEAGSALANSTIAPETANELRYYRAKAYLAQKRNEEAIGDLKKLATDTRNVYGAEAKYQLGQLYYNTRQFDKAEQEVLDYISVSTPHSYWLARSFILLSDVYMQKEKNIEAKQYLLSLKQSYHGAEDIAAMIETRLKKLEQQSTTQQ